MAEHVHTHTHDGIDWTSRLAAFRRADALNAPALRSVAERLVELVPDGATVADIGPGGGGMSAALATALAARGGGKIVLVDAVAELLEAAEGNVRAEAEDGGKPVEVVSLRVDAASADLPQLLSGVDLVWASRVVHHLPDQQKGIAGLVEVLAPGGWLALCEGGLGTRCLPFDLGVGEPGLQDRLDAVHAEWFVAMRAGMEGAVRLPVGWTKAMARAGLVDTSSFTYLVDLPAPPSELVWQSVVDWLSWCAGVSGDRLSESDQAALARLLDPDDEAYVGARDDVFVLTASTVHLGQRPTPM
jgi:SAM-dependent methyltransferase